METMFSSRAGRGGVGTLLALAVAGLSLLTTSCGNNSSGGGGGTTGGTGTPAAQTAAGGGQGAELTGAGATFPAPLYQRWFQEYAAKNGVRINYQPIGSGGGIKQITAKAVDFGASDAPMNDQELAAAAGILHIPTVAGAVCLSYNLPGAPPNLKLTGDVIAGMFLGTITTWNDPKIAALNPGVTLPATKIVTAHRSDGSGTTNIFTTYLSQVSPDWKQKVGAGKSVNWPNGLGGKGNPGVATFIKQNPGCLGYIELAYAMQNKLPFAQVQNAKGNFIAPSVQSTTAAASGVTLPPDFRKVITNTSDPKGYPITGFTFLLVYPNAKPAVKQFLLWAMSDGQKDAPTLYYAPLPPTVQKAAVAKINTIQ